MRGAWDRDTVGLLIAISTLPVLIALFLADGLSLQLLVALPVVLIWQAVFRAIHATPFSATGVVTALSFAIFAGGDLMVWQIILSVSFGVIFAELLFGGWGRNFLSAAVVAPAFAYLSFPEIAHAAPSLIVGIGAILSAVLLLAIGIISLRILASAAIVVAFAMFFDVLAIDAAGALIFAAVFLLCDPVASSVTSLGRILYGTLGGALAVLFITSGQPVVNAAIYAVLLSQIFAPLVDEIAIALHSYRRSNG